jgi:hypothetical protein
MLPRWQLKALSMAEGQPLSVSLPKWPGNLHFYDAKAIQIKPLSPNYFTVEQKFEEVPEKLISAIKESLGRHRILTNDTTVELLVESKIVKAKIKLL